MNTQFVKMISGLALMLAFTQASLASSGETSNTCLPVYMKTRAFSHKIRPIDWTSTVQPVSQFKDILSDRNTKGFSSFSSGQSFLNYQINGNSFKKAFRVENRIFYSVPDVKKVSTPAVTEIGENQK